jgi:hypothetical protein
MLGTEQVKMSKLQRRIYAAVESFFVRWFLLAAGDRVPLSSNPQRNGAD